ncbi:MAG: Sporulation initiation phosphotransferase F, partial [Alphaproteobacteria bacterium MarineAlpha9_Bin2]
MNKDILIVDDEKDIRVLISDILKDEDYSPRVASNSDQALSELSKGLPDLVLLDIWLEGSQLDGLELLNQIHLFYPNIPCIMISGHGNIDIAV